MGQVIPWPKPESRPVRTGLEPDGPMGRVFLFLGVRYERHVDAESASDAAVAPRRLQRERAPGRRKRC